MRKIYLPVVMAMSVFALTANSSMASPPPSPSTPVAVDPAPLALPPTPGSQNTGGMPPAASSAANDPFNPLNSSPTPGASPSPMPAATTTPAGGAAPFDPFANASSTAPAPTANPAPSMPLAIPNSPLNIPPPDVAPTGGNLVQNSGAANTPFGSMGGNVPPPPPEVNPTPAPAMADMEPAKPKAKPKPRFKPSLAAGKKAFDKGQFETAKKHFLPLAKKGNAEAQYMLGVIYSHAKGKDRDYQKAAQWYDKASIQGMKEAQFNLGFMLYQGAGTAGDPKSIAADPAIAAKYLADAANQNVPMAQHLLSLLNMRGIGMPVNYTEALRWSSAAADNGIQEAMFNAAMLSVRRPGATMQDYISSYKWFTILAGKGYPGAAENRAQITKYMPTSAIQYADSLARNWQPASNSMMERPDLVPDFPVPGNSSVFPAPSFTYSGTNSMPQMGQQMGNMQTAQPMANPNAWPWPQGDVRPPMTNQPHPYPEIRERERYMLSN